ncbi:MAG: hypothetical protein KKB81_01665 [Candidatus Margulisbacteria bacterium]|nr:hypothetical protein [Candidatus Margulisiibacteriota bacterium]MBU1021623.1 hypothetical protein [Candidatus Margulisiibacteriota bacterium]MBU1728773.1 hypothetical protein [Candidatus Margulisiibacteriota bacterium]MBU1955739.1 hypothetical protein [Candidatus Margulisiibacteriota bacterium]
MKAKVPFVFYTSSQLVQITGKKAAHLKEFVEVMKEVEDSTIFYHIHHAYREHQFAPGAYSNDFAHWVGEELGESALAEKLANLSIKDVTSLSVLRSRIIEIVEEFLNNATEIRRAAPQHEFYFCKNIGFISKTKYQAWDLGEFCEMLKKVGLRSLFFHFFEARLRLNRRTNDFSDWIKADFNDAVLANKIEALDPYVYTLDELRDKIISLIKASQGFPWKKAVKWLSSKLKITQK